MPERALSTLKAERATGRRRRRPPSRRFREHLGSFLESPQCQGRATVRDRLIFQWRRGCRASTCKPWAGRLRRSAPRPAVGPGTSDMKADEGVGIADRSPEAVLNFWLGRLRTAADASRRNWQQGMLRWRLGPFARGAEDPNVLRPQREWCERIHREGPDRFFRDPVWDTPRGVLAKLIVLDQFPRRRLSWDGAGLRERLPYRVAVVAGLRRRPGVSRTTTSSSASGSIFRFPMRRTCTFQELSIEKFARWSVGPRRRSAARAAPDQPVRKLVDGQGPRNGAHRDAAPLRPLPTPKRRHAAGSPRRRSALPHRPDAPAVELHPAAGPRTTSPCWARCAGCGAGLDEQPD